MSTLVLNEHGHTERHDSLLSMLFAWATAEPIVKAVLSRQLCEEEVLLKTAYFARLTGQGKRECLSEHEVAQCLLGFFLMDRTVRRAVAKWLSKTQTMRRGDAMVALVQLRDQLLVLVEGQIGSA